MLLPESTHADGMARDMGLEPFSMFEITTPARLGCGFMPLAARARDADTAVQRQRRSAHSRRVEGHVARRWRELENLGQALPTQPIDTAHATHHPTPDRGR